MVQAEPYPVNERIEILDHFTIRKSSKYWTAILMIRYRQYQVSRPVLAFYRWARRRNRETGQYRWKTEKKWTINCVADWYVTRAIINEKFLLVWEEMLKKLNKGEKLESNYSEDSLNSS